MSELSESLRERHKCECYANGDRCSACAQLVTEPPDAHPTNFVNRYTVHAPWPCDAILAAREVEVLEREPRCDSCGTRVEDPDANRCCGCDELVCFLCVEAFGHETDGAHGSGDPSEWWNERLREVEELRHRFTQSETQRAYLEKYIAKATRDGFDVAAQRDAKVRELEAKIAELTTDLELSEAYRTILIQERETSHSG